MRSSFYCSSLCLLGIQGLLLRSLSSLVINCCALLNACPDGNVVMLDEVGSFFFHYGRTEFHYAKATKLQEFGKPTYLA
jgi:hypothetical protein